MPRKVFKKKFKLPGNIITYAAVLQPGVPLISGFNVAAIRLWLCGGREDLGYTPTASELVCNTARINKST